MKLPGLLGAAAVLALSTFAGGDGRAAEGWPVVVTNASQGALLVEVAAGVAMPCDSSANRPLYRGAIAPGATLQLFTTEGTVCFRHTSGGFPGVDWSTPALFSPGPVICTGGRSGRRCWPAPGATIQLVAGDPSR